MKPRVMGQFYECEFEDHEKNQRDLSNSRKESSMKKLTLEHSEAVSAAKAQMIYKADSNQPARYKALLEEQIVLLGEVYWWVLNSIYNPGLPFEGKEPSDGPANGG